ncbi:hypothetical protein ACQP2T_63995 (plasmid) [Nonomuraea sp. CA-143628]|uniref:hypothetical protein n=1 Tax=Nonomuraea sp. CA-143628 TaxID=3239997 RepID=UPI003D8F4404
MADDLRQRVIDVVLQHIPKDQYPGEAARREAVRLADIVIAIRDSDPGYWRERAEKAEAITNALTWLIAAGVQITIGACDHQGGAELRVAVDLDDDPAWYGDLSDCLADAKNYCSARGVEP